MYQQDQQSNLLYCYKTNATNSMDSLLTCNNFMAAALNNTSVLGCPQPYLPPAEVQIIEQPKERGLRFRYLCEARAAGIILGQSSTEEKKSYPTIKVTNRRGRTMKIAVSCVTKDTPPRLHPHSLVGKSCKSGVYSTVVEDSDVVEFKTLGVQCAKRNEVDQALKDRASVNVNPFKSSSIGKNKDIDLGVIRLCFQVVLYDNSGAKEALPPIVSNCIYDKKTVTELSICRISKQAGSVAGGDEVFLLCEKVVKNDIRVRFYEEKNGNVVWEANALFGPEDVHRQYAICFRTPPYHDQLVQKNVSVCMQLIRPSDHQCSSPKTFCYFPKDPDPDAIASKRRRTVLNGNELQKTCTTTSGLCETMFIGEHDDNVRTRLRHKLTNRHLSTPSTTDTLNNIVTSTIATTEASPSAGNELDQPAKVANQEQNFDQNNLNFILDELDFAQLLEPSQSELTQLLESNQSEFSTLLGTDQSEFVTLLGTDQSGMAELPGEVISLQEVTISDDQQNPDQLTAPQTFANLFSTQTIPGQSSQPFCTDTSSSAATVTLMNLKEYSISDTGHQLQALPQ